MLFRRIVLWALLVGAVSGLLLSAVQFWQVIPIIHSAERFETASEPASAPAHSHAGDEHPAGAWEPAPGAERIGYTFLSNVLTATGFALVILAAMVALRGRMAATRSAWRNGLFWGAAGYGVFFLAPALGLPPEIPGATAAPLEARQLWWVFTVACTAAGLMGAAFLKTRWRWACIGLLLVPHLVGAPRSATAPFAEQPSAAAAELEELARQFIGATALANAVLWLALGLASAWAVRRMMSSPADL